MPQGQLFFKYICKSPVRLIRSANLRGITRYRSLMSGLVEISKSTQVADPSRLDFLGSRFYNLNQIFNADVQNYYWDHEIVDIGTISLW